MRSLHLSVLAAAGALLAPGPLQAYQAAEGDGPRREAPVTVPAQAVPFGPGERLRYKVYLGRIPVGEAYLHVENVDTVRGYPSYHLAMGIDGEHLFGTLQIHDRYESWMDIGMLVSRRFHRNIHEVSYKSRRLWEIYPEEQRWERVDADVDGETPFLALDELSFIYYARTLPLEVGETRTLDRYFKMDGNPVSLRVLRKETVQVPAGEFDVVVVQPTFQTSGLFSQGGEAEIYLTDDENRHVVFLTSKIPYVGSLSMRLTEVTEGTPLVEGSRDR